MGNDQGQRVEIGTEQATINNKDSVLVKRKKEDDADQICEAPLKNAAVQDMHSSVAPAIPIQGLALVQLGETGTLLSALAELRPEIALTRPASRSSSAMLELGWSFTAADKEGVWRLANPVANFPNTRELINEAMGALGEEQLNEDRLNVIVRRYTSGQNIPLHFDKKEMFDEDVYSCVLSNTSDQVLKFVKQDTDGEIVEEHLAPERPGMVCRQRGAARFEWLHGVETVTRGERFSVTWRWFAHGYVPRAKAKGWSGRPGGQEGWSGASGGKGWSGRSGGYNTNQSMSYSRRSGGR